MDTIDLLWLRLKGGANGEDYSNWALSYLGTEHESEAMVLLAANDDYHWEERERIFLKAMQGFGEPIPETKEELLNQMQGKLIKQYLDGKISGVEMVAHGYELCLESDYDAAYSIWMALDDDLSLCESEYGSLVYTIDPNDKEGCIRKILKDEGLI